MATSPLQAELKALLLGLQVAATSWNRIEVHTDSTEVLNLIKNPYIAKGDTKALLSDISSIIASLNYLCCSKVPRSCIKKAHNLATIVRKIGS